MPTFWGYCRISKKDQSRWSLENQELLQTKYCPEGFELRLRREEQSGRNFSGRIVLDEILRESTEGDIVSFVDNSRFGRTTKENIEVADILRSKKVKFHIGNQEVVFDAAGRYRFTMESAASEYFSTLQAEKSLAGMITAKKKGEWLYSSRLWGYEHTKSGVQIVQSEAEVLRELFGRYSQGESLNSITRDLNERGTRNRKGTPLIVATLSKMLDNPIYMGYSLPHGVSVPDKATLVRSEIYKEAIINEQLWWKCWNLRRTIIRPHSIQYEYRWGHYPLGGMIKCPYCKKSYVHNHKRSRGKIYDLYAVPMHQGCQNKTSAVSSKVIEEAVKLIYMLHVMFAQEITDEKKAEIISSVSTKKRDIERLERNRDESRKKMRSLLAKIDLVGDNQLALQMLKSDISITETEFRAADQAIERFRSDILNLEDEERELIAKFKTEAAVRVMKNQFAELKAQFAEMFDLITLCNKRLAVQADGFIWSCILPIGAKSQPESIVVQCHKHEKMRQQYRVRFSDISDESELSKPVGDKLSEMISMIPPNKRAEHQKRKEARASQKESVDE